MAKILVISDLHLTKPGKKIIGLDPVERFHQGLAHAAKHHGDAHRLILLGDLVHFGSSVEYARLVKALEGLPWPVSLMAGNHDRRDKLIAAFPDTPTEDGFVQNIVDLGDVVAITLDTLDEAPEIKHAGRLCDLRLRWLEIALAKTQDKPALIFLHHPPFKTGFTGMDAIGLQNPDALFDVLSGSSAVHFFCGHIHRNITATSHGFPITVFKSPCHQMPMMLGAEGSGHSVDEPGGYGIVLTDGADIVVHFEDFTLPAQTPADF